MFDMSLNDLEYYLSDFFQDSGSSLRQSPVIPLARGGNGHLQHTLSSETSLSLALLSFTVWNGLGPI